MDSWFNFQTAETRLESPGMVYRPKWRRDVCAAGIDQHRQKAHLTELEQWVEEKDFVNTRLHKHTPESRWKRIIAVSGTRLANDGSKIRCAKCENSFVCKKALNGKEPAITSRPYTLHTTQRTAESAPPVSSRSAETAREDAKATSERRQ